MYAHDSYGYLGDERATNEDEKEYEHALEYRRSITSQDSCRVTFLEST